MAYVILGLYDNQSYSSVEFILGPVCKRYIGYLTVSVLSEEWLRRRAGMLLLLFCRPTVLTFYL